MKINQIYFIKILRRVARELLLKHRNEGRYIIERKIFPRIKGKKVLLVGCAPYTENYPKRLAKNELYSIDIDEKMREYGAKNHIIGNVVEINKYFKKQFFDVILFFGVFGYGLNKEEEAEETLKNFHFILKDNGLLFIMWQDSPEHNQINPRKLKNFNLFTKIKFADYGSGYKTKKNQIFEFLMCAKAE